MSRYASSSSFSGSGNRFYDDRHGGRYRDDGDARPSFSLSESDFQRDAVLKRRRYLSPARAVNTSSSSSSYNTSSRHTNNHSSSSYNRYDSTSDRRGQSIASGAGFQQQQPPHRSSTYVSSSSSSGTRTLHPNPSPAVPMTPGSSSGITSSLSFGVTAKAAAARAAAASAVSTSTTSAVPTPRTTATAQAATAASALEEPVAFRVRSKSKSRARKMAAPKKPSGTEFIALGQREKTMNPYKATYHGSDKYRSVRSRSRSVGATGAKIATPAITVAATTTSSSASTRRAGTNSSSEEESRGRTRERERERELEREREALPAPKAALAKTSASSKLSRAKAEEKSARSKSKARSHKSKSSRRSSSNSSSDGDSSSRGRRRTTATRSKSHSRKASAKRTSPSPSSSASSSSLPPRRELRYRSKSKLKGLKRSEKKDERSRGKSKSKARSSATTTTAVGAGTASEDIDAEIESTKRKLKDAKKELQVLEDEQRELQTRIEAKNYQIKHLELDLETVEKRKRIELEYTRSEAASTRSAPESRPTNTAVATTSGISTTARESDRRKRSVSKARGASKRPCIVDTDESDDDGEVIILDPITVKQEKSLKRQRSSSKSRAQSKPAKSTAAVQPVPVQVPMDNSLTENAVRTEIPDFFWGKADTPKLLAQHRVRTIPDGSTRKGRHLAFNPKISDYFATNSDDGGLIMWSYERPKHEISKMATFAPTSFRRDSQCAESIVWSPDGNRLAMAFRDPIDGMGEFCVVMLHELELGDPNKPQQIPADRVTSKSTTLHSRGISAIEWIPSGIGSDMTSRSLVTAGSDHAVVLWEEHDDVNNENDYKWNVLHREHRSEVKSICVHSQRQAIYTGGFDGQVIRYDMHRFAPHTVMERRKPSISKINAVLEHPHNPNILLVSSVEQSEHSILLHDLRQRYNSSRDATMTLSWVKSSDSKSMSQYIVPRWSPAGMHVSCGSKSGLVNIWDVRVRGPSYPVVLPQQSVAVHPLLHKFIDSNEQQVMERHEYNSFDITTGMAEERLISDEHQQQTRPRSAEDLDAAERGIKAFKFEIPDDPELRIDDLERLRPAPPHTGHVARRQDHYQALEQRVAELEKRLKQQELRCREEHSAAGTAGHGDSKVLPRENDQLIEFFLTEMEKYQTMTSKLSVAHVKLQQELHEHQQLMQRFQSNQSVRMYKHLEIMRRMEKEFVHGERLRGEEKQLAVAQSKKRIESVKRLVEEQLLELRTQEELQRSQLEDKLEKKFVDVVVENQVLKTENMELRGDLQHVSALARSNKKMIRILTEEILKIKRTAVVYPTEIDELAAFRSLNTSDFSVFNAALDAVHPKPLLHPTD